MQMDVGIVCVLTDSELPAVLRAFGISPDHRADENVEGSRYWLVNIVSQAQRRKLRVVITAVGESGNPSASAATTSLIMKYQPGLVCLVGIAAGVQTQLALGDIVIASSVIGYEKEKLLPGDDRDLRPTHKEPPFAIRADLQHFIGRFPYDRLRAGVASQVAALSAASLPPLHLMPSEIHVVAKSIASGEKIFGDGSLADLARTYQDKRIVAGEMEGVGFAVAAERKRCAWIIVRGISDFGDPTSKDGRNKDRFHNFASITAAETTLLFLETQYSAAIPASHHNLDPSKRNRLHKVVSVTALCLIVSGIVWVWDYNRLKIGHFASVGTRWGVPEGVTPLDEKTWRRRQSHFRLEFRQNRVRRVLLVNSVGEFSEDDDTDVYAQEIFYRQDGTLQQITQRDAKRNVIMRETYGERRRGDEGIIQYVDFWAEHRDEPYAWSSQVGSLGVSDPRHLESVSEITAQQLNYDNVGHTVRILYLNTRRQPRSNAEGAFGAAFTYDGGSILPATVDLLGPQGTPAPGWNGRLRMTISRDTLADVSERRYFGADGKPVVGTPGCHQETFTQDEHGNMTEFACYGTDTEPTAFEHGYHRSTQSFDQEGNLVAWAHFGIDNKPTLDRDGVHACKRRFDNQGHPTEWAYYGLNGYPTLNNEGYHLGKRAFDANGNVIETSYFGTDGNPIIANNGRHRVQYRYDTHGNEIEEATFGIGRIPAQARHVVRRRYDAHSRLVRQTFFGVDGKPTSDANGVHCYAMVRDTQGNVIELAVFGVDGKPIMHDDGYHRLNASFDVSGNPVGRAFFGTDGAPLSINGYHRYTEAFDTLANTSETRFFDIDGHASVGVALVKDKFDTRGNLTETTYYDSRGKPTQSEDGYHRRRCTVDERGYATECAFYAPDDSPVMNRDGIHRVVMAGLNRYGISSDETYWGIGGEPVRDKTGVHRRVKSFDSKGDIVESASFGLDEQKPSSAMSAVETALQSLVEKKVEFTQSFTAKGSRTPVVESGTAIFGAPPLMRWDYVTPEIKMFIFDGKKAWLYVVRTHELTTTTVGEKLRENLPLLFLTDSAWLDANYRMSESRTGLERSVRLVSKTDTLSIAELIVVRNVDDNLLRRVDYVDRDGNRMVFALSGHHGMVVPKRFFTLE